MVATNSDVQVRTAELDLTIDDEGARRFRFRAERHDGEWSIAWIGVSKERASNFGALPSRFTTFDDALLEGIRAIVTQPAPIKKVSKGKTGATVAAGG